MYNVHYHIFVRKSHLFAYVINEEVHNPYECSGQIAAYFTLRRWCHCDT